MGSIKKDTLSRIFIRYVLAMALALLAWFAGCFLLLYLLIFTGCIYPADYAEQQIDRAMDVLQNAEEITQELIPSLCEYVLFSEDGSVISGDLSDQELLDARQAMEQGAVTGSHFYKVIPRLDGKLLLRYSLEPQYRLELFREHLPAPQSLMLLGMLIGALLLIALLSMRFGKKVKGSMQPVLHVIEQIKDQNLDYTHTHSDIKEFEDCILSLEDMRMALRDSLEQQWKAEQEKSRQISALAHDIKTPLTIVRGNAELLAETKLEIEQKRQVEEILTAVATIQNYTKKLIDVSKARDGNLCTMERVAVREISDEIRRQAEGLAEIYALRIVWEETVHRDYIEASFDHLVPAVINIVQNAAEHSTAGSAIRILIKEEDSRLSFTIEDEGKGFSTAALQHADEAFFMEDASRSSDLHFGIGLYFARTVAQEHGGYVRLSNVSPEGGARVELVV